MNDLFAEASRRSLRFDTPQGALSVEDLWNLPLSTNRSGRANLDDIAIGLNKQIQEAGTTSFVKKPSKTNEVLKLKFDIVIQVITVKQAEAEAEETIRANAEKKQQILSIIANKENEALSGKSIEELQAIAATL